MGQNYDYDASGDRVRLDLPSTPATYWYFYNDPNTHQLSATTGPSPARINKYEGGNLVDDGTRTFVYDARGRMIQTTWGSVVTDYVVNGLGQRVRKTVNSGPLAGTTYYFYDEAGHLLGEYDGSGNLIQEYVWDGDTPVAVIRGPVSNPQIFSIETDHLGTPRQIRDASAALAVGPELSNR